MKTQTPASPNSARVCGFLVAALCGLATVPAFGATSYSFIVESRSGGLNYANFSAPSGWATSGGNVNAPGCTLNIGSMYSGTGTLFGPSRYAQYGFTPSTSGYYEVDLAWTLTAGQIATAVNLYTGAATGNTTPDQWGNTGGPMGVLYSGTMDMYNKNYGVWNLFTTYNMTAGTTYKVGIYGGYKTPYAGGPTPADASANRVTAGAALFQAATPGAAAYAGIGNGTTDVPVSGTGNELSWTPGNYTLSYDVYLGTSSGSLTRVASDLGVATTSLDLDSMNLQPGTEYYWRVDSRNLDVVTPGPQNTFTTTAVPEPSSVVVGLAGGLALFFLWRRRHS